MYYDLCHETHCHGTGQWHENDRFRNITTVTCLSYVPNTRKYENPLEEEVSSELVFVGEK